MSKAVLISIRPKWCELIVDGEKTVEVRKTRPKIELPFKCYIYQTNQKWSYDRLIRQDRLNTTQRLTRGLGKVIGEFVCDKLYPVWAGVDAAGDQHLKSGIPLQDKTCLSEDALFDYLFKGIGNSDGWGWHISSFQIYDTPKDLSEFMKPCENDLYCEICAMYSEFQDKCGNKALTLSRPPQSWCYVEEQK